MPQLNSRKEGDGVRGVSIRKIIWLTALLFIIAPINSLADIGQAESKVGISFENDVPPAENNEDRPNQTTPAENSALPKTNSLESTKGMYCGLLIISLLVIYKKQSVEQNKAPRSARKGENTHEKK